MNGYADANRAKKVIAILAVLPPTKTQMENDVLALFLEALTQPQRDVYGLLAGCKSNPSPTTWGLVVAAVRARHVPGDGGSVDWKAEVKRPDFAAIVQEQFHTGHKLPPEQCSRCERLARFGDEAFDAGLAQAVRAVGL